jgi:hypothetical protein
VLASDLDREAAGGNASTRAHVQAARAVGDGALATMPDGFEFTESIALADCGPRRFRRFHRLDLARWLRRAALRRRQIG